MGLGLMFLSSVRILKRVNLQLNKLEVEIRKVQEMNNKVEAIVQLFKMIAPIHDTDYFASEIAELSKRKNKDNEVEVLKELRTCLQCTGRSNYGINRTQKGEAVTADKIYLGNLLFQIQPHPAAYWLSYRDQLERITCSAWSDLYAEKASVWQVVHNHECCILVNMQVFNILKYIALLKGDSAENG